ncbi:MAG: winged helix-turn-helix domain-containing protein [Chitinophagaceae bacterium]|nr:winged helix-turn-helix domain-containing protein [Chitinophagaceae bacterium]
MASENIYRHILIDEDSVTPKYLQIVNSVLKAVQQGYVGMDYVLPSINDLSFELNIARDTAERAYRQLKKLGVVGSIPGKGYFISDVDIRQDIRVLLLFNKLSAHKKIIYDAFVDTLGDHAAIDFYIYNNDVALFRRVVRNRRKGYTHVVIIPHFIEGSEKAAEIIDSITEGQLILLDKAVEGVQRPYGSVYEDFGTDIYGALVQALPRLSRYRRLRLLTRTPSYFPAEIREGFERFCIQYAFPFDTLQNADQIRPDEGDVFLSLTEDDMLTLIDRILSEGLQPGTDVGLISYNETPGSDSSSTASPPSPQISKPWERWPPE